MVTIDDITRDDLSETLKELADEWGLENILMLYQKFRNKKRLEIYIPRHFYNPNYKNYINLQKEYNGKNSQELAIKYKLDIITTREVIKRKNIKKIPENVQKLLKIIPEKELKKLISLIGGAKLGLPKLDVCLNRVKKRLQNIKIQKEFNGSNYAELEKKYKLSNMTIRAIIARGKLQKIREANKTG